MPTLSGLAAGCAIADTCGAETGLVTCPVLAVASITGDSEVAMREQVAPVSTLAVLDYVPVYACTVMSNKKLK